MYPERISASNIDDLILVEQLLKAGRDTIVQFSSTVENLDILKSLNILAQKFERQLEIRFFGFYGSSFDASILAHIPNVYKLTIDFMEGVDNIDALADMQNLKVLRLGISNLNRPNILSLESLRNLEELSVVKAKRNKIDLSPIESLHELNDFFTCGETSNIEVLSSAKKLKRLGLSSIPKQQSIDFVSQIEGLEKLFMILGGRTSIAEIKAPNLQSLEIVRVRGLSDLGSIGRFPLLRIFKIEDQIQLQEIEFNENKELNEVKLLNCKNLKTLRNLEHLSSLEHLRIYNSSIDYESLTSEKLPESLEIFGFYTGKSKADKLIKADLAVRGFKEF